MSFIVLFFVLFGCAGQTPSSLGSPLHQAFLQCLFSHPSNPASFSNVTYTPTNSSYLHVLQSTISNLRFSTPTTPKPLFLITPLLESDIVAAIICSRKHGLQVRIRSGGHDFEGLSYVSDVPFIVIDMMNLRTVSVDVKSETAWVQSGATIGELYYAIAEKSRSLGFPAGSCPTIGVGGHFGGGGYGMMLRKYGLAADNVIDARVVVANGTVLTRKSMGKDLFWAIRGGGAPSFAVVVAWKIKLVHVPRTVTVFTASRNSSQSATELVYRWQNIAHNVSKDLNIVISVNSVNAGENGSGRSVQAALVSFYLGKTSDLLALMHETFPELGLVRNECVEMSWIEAIVVFAGFPLGSPLETLLNRTAASRGYYKLKSDYVTMPMSRASLEGFWSRMNMEREQQAQVFMVPYGGIMSEISASKIPFPHRAGNLYKIGYFVAWTEEEERNGESKRHIEWIRKLYRYLTPHVSKSPRGAYLNYRDLDLGTNEKGNAVTSYQRASIWGRKYFDKNFDRLVRAKAGVDPTNFFKNEQSIPVVPWKI